MSNSDLEDEWVPNGRPQSIMARSFSAALDDAFKLDTDLEGLSQSVEQKKRSLSSRQTELEELEAKLRAAEARLRQSTSRTTSSPSKSPLPDRSRNVSDGRKQSTSPLGARQLAPRVATPSDDDDEEEEEQQQQRKRRVNGIGNRGAPAPQMNRRPVNSGAQNAHPQTQGRPQGTQRTNGGSFLQEEDDEDDSSEEDEEEDEQEFRQAGARRR